MMDTTISARLRRQRRALLKAINEAEVECANVWREPYEMFDSAQRYQWLVRGAKAMRAYLALLDQC